MKNAIQIMCVAAIVAGLGSTAMADTDYFGTGGDQFGIDFVTISGATNPASGYGIVNNDYRIGVYEITNDQYDKFVAAHGAPTGSPTSAYSQTPVWTGANVPTNMVSWVKAAQFVNWLNTSTGHQAAYKFTDTPNPNSLGVWSAAEAEGGTNLFRHKDAVYYLPTEHELVKAAYWNGTAMQTYANASPGDLVAGVPDPTKRNYQPSAGNSPWDVGSGVLELNGTYDIMGNVFEWAESARTNPDTNYVVDTNRIIEAGAYGYPAANLAFAKRNYGGVYAGAEELGFRVASDFPAPAPVPVPGAAVLGMIGIGMVGAYTRKRRQTNVAAA